jgi:hypothetical protein
LLNATTSRKKKTQEENPVIYATGNEGTNNLNPEESAGPSPVLSGPSS